MDVSWKTNSWDFLDFSKEFLGKTITAVHGGEKGDSEIIFLMSDGTAYKMFHEQDCCEEVAVEDTDAPLSSLIGLPLLRAEVATSKGEYHTWTFYKLATNLASVTIRWYGSSNGYYSEEVNLVKGEIQNKGG